MASPPPSIKQWIVDTRQLWPIDEKIAARQQAKVLGSVAISALELLPEADQTSILKYYFASDARMSLVSGLLKRYTISSLCDVPWNKAVPSRKPDHKPCYVPSSSSTSQLEFNVSHQAGLVTCVAALSSAGREIELGTDVVCVNERNDQGRMSKEPEGFFAFVDMHADVFADGEIHYLKLGPDNLNLAEMRDVGGYARDAISRCQHRDQVVRWRDKTGAERTMQSNVVIDAKLRRFYSLWCLREAYVKMTGEALLAPWLKELEFRSFRAPNPSTRNGGENEVGETATEEEFEIWFKGKRVRDVKMEMVALGKDFMVATAARFASGVEKELLFEEWKLIDVEKDIYPVAKGTVAT